MREYNIVEGDICNAISNIIAHQVNCQGKMNSGVAKAIRTKWSKVYEQYMVACNTLAINKAVNPNESLLGKIQFVSLANGETDIFSKPQYCVNMFTQEFYGYGGRQYTSVEAFKSALKSINESCKDMTIAFPWLIGCVRGGADWNEILPLILTELTDVKSITFYKY